MWKMLKNKLKEFSSIFRIIILIILILPIVSSATSIFSSSGSDSEHLDFCSVYDECIEYLENQGMSDRWLEEEGIEIICNNGYCEAVKKNENEGNGNNGGEGGSSGGGGGFSNEDKKECEGCLLNNKCVLFGYRTSDKYCDISGSLKIQKEEDKSCNNNFECKSNICVDNKCISSSLIQRILNFFKKLFGL